MAACIDLRGTFGPGRHAYVASSERAPWRELQDPITPTLLRTGGRWPAPHPVRNQYLSPACGTEVNPKVPLAQFLKPQMSKRSALGRRLHNLSQDSQEGDVALWKSIHPGEIGKHSMTARSKRSVALMGATLVMVTACSESPDESASVDVNKYSGDSACDLLPGEKLNQSGITEPCRPMDTSIGLPGCEWSGDALVPLVISLGQELSELVKADTEDKVSESGNIGGFAAGDQLVF